MGYKLPRRTLRINFEGTDYDGAEVVLHLNTSVEDYLEFHDTRHDPTEREMFELIADRLDSWNLEDDAGPIPATMDGVLRLGDVGFIQTLFTQWRKTVQEAADLSPLPQRPSLNGATSEILT